MRRSLGGVVAVQDKGSVFWSQTGRNCQRPNHRAMSPRAYRIGDIPTWRANAVLKVLAEP
jgi:hypothetical protein